MAVNPPSGSGRRTRLKRRCCFFICFTILSEGSQRLRFSPLLASDSAKISTALADSRLNLAMAAILSFCRNVGAIPWVVVVISTTYWVSVLTVKKPNRKVGLSQLAGSLAIGLRVDRWNHLSQHPSMLSEFAPFAAILGWRDSASHDLVSPAQGECCA